MLINSLALKNFKCFEELDVKFAPITLLTGANSSGKSSLIYAILAMLQTEEFPFYLSPNGKYVNLGGYEEIAFGKDENKRISIRFRLHPRSLSGRLLQYDTTWQNDVNGLPTLYELDIKFSHFELSIKNQNDKYSVNMNSPSLNSAVFQKQTLAERLKAIFDKIPIKDELFISENGSVILKNAKFSSADKMLRDFILPAMSIIRIIMPGASEMFSRNIERNLFNYIGSFRLPPERTYYQKAKATHKIASSGEGYIDQIIEWEETEPDKLAELNVLMKELELFDEIQSSKIKGGRFELNVKTLNSSYLSSLTDVGFGISQFLPVIVADIQLSDRSCLAVSQPEIHLHPKIQAVFGNYLANQIKRTRKQYIIETHSEYLLNRIRLLLVTGELKPEDVRVLYFENDGVKSTVHDVEFATDGQIKGAPQGFFDTYGIDVMNIAMNAVA